MFGLSVMSLGLGVAVAAVPPSRLAGIRAMEMVAGGLIACGLVLLGSGLPVSR